MRKLTKPDENARDVFLTCISRVRNPDLKNRLESIADEIENASIAYEQAAENAQLFTIVSQTSINDVNNSELKKVYTDRMAKKGSPGRTIYDKLIALPKYGKCPLCGQRIVSTLDHYLAKADYATLIVTPINLIAACSDCNKIKSDKNPTTPEEQTLHPYYDDTTTDQWLFAKVIQEAPPSVIFFVRPPDNWDSILAERVKNHFSILELGSLYASHAGSELINIQTMLENLLEKGSPDLVREHLEETANSYQCAHINSWQTAMYYALAESDWFCNGGFYDV